MKTALSKPTHIEAVRDMAYNQMLQVCGYLGWTEDQYNTHQLDQYLEFMNIRFTGYPEVMMNEVRYSPMMAGLWKNEWIGRNAIAFLPIASDDMEESMSVNELGKLVHYVPDEFIVSQIYDEYLWIHSAKRLANDEGFMKQFNQVIKLIIKENKKCARR